MAEPKGIPPEIRAKLEQLRQEFAQKAEIQRRLQMGQQIAEEAAKRNKLPLLGQAKGGLMSRKEREAGLEKFLSDSKIKERLYHATPHEFSEFKPGGADPTLSGRAIWMSADPKRQPAAHNIHTKGSNYKQGVRVMPLHVKAKNPLVLDDPTMIEWAREVFAGGSKEFPELLAPQWIDEVRKEGYDSIHFADPYGRGDPHEVIMFEPNKIKSAIGNRGTYDITNPDITKAKGGSVMGVNVASDRKAGLNYADLIVDGHKTLESRNTDSLRPYVGKRVAIVRTGHGPAKAIGEVTIGEPMVVNKKKFRSLERQHMVPAGSAFDISTPTKHLYPLSDPQRYEQEHDVGHGIVARKVMHKADGGTIPSLDVMRLAIGGQGASRNWLRGSVEQVIDPLLQRAAIGSRHYLYGPEHDEAIRQEIAELKQKVKNPKNIDNAPKFLNWIAEHENTLKSPDVNKVAINKWIQSNLTNYIKKQMATHDDPIRKLAEQGIVHMPPEQMGLNRHYADDYRRMMEGSRLAKSPEARAWEDATDVTMARTNVKNLLEVARLKGPHDPKTIEPWMEKADPETHLFYPRDSMHAHYLGFDHLVDVLKEDLAEGRVRPEQLNKVSIEQAVRRAYEYDQEKKRKMAETALKATEDMPVHKDYGNGFKWIELKMPEKLPEGWTKKTGALGETLHYDPQGRMSVNPNQEKLEQALKYEGDTMGHCVGGYCPDVAAGKTRIFSLRDAKNEPHVTIEVKPKSIQEGIRNLPDEERFALAQEVKDQHFGGVMPHVRDEDKYWDLMDKHYVAKHGMPAPSIKQIKGKQNQKPKKDYIPYVQDFVKSGNWSNVSDIQNAEMRGIHPESDLAKAMQQKGLEVPKYVTEQEMSGLLKEHNQGLYSWNKADGGEVDAEEIFMGKPKKKVATHAHHLEIEERLL